jgi:hypothetical protein
MGSMKGFVADSSSLVDSAEAIPIGIVVRGV